MRFYTQQHQHYVGVDLHARSLCACVLDADGNKKLYRQARTRPDAFLDLIDGFEGSGRIRQTSGITGCGGSLPLAGAAKFSSNRGMKTAGDSGIVEVFQRRVGGKGRAAQASSQRGETFATA